MDIGLKWISTHWYMGCDQQCKPCYLGPFKDPGLCMPMAERIRHIELLARYKTEQVFIVGGNPVLDPFIEETLALIKSHGIKTEIVSNSWNLSWVKDRAAFLENVDDKAATIFGATSEVHDALNGQPGSFQRLHKNVLQLSAAGASFVPVINILPQNKGMLYGIIRGLRDFMRFDKVWLQRIFPYGNALNHDGLYLQAPDLNLVCAQLERARDDFNLSEALLTMPAAPCLVDKRYRRLMEPYLRGTSFFAIDWSGRLFGESFDIAHPKRSLFGGKPMMQIDGDLIFAIEDDPRTKELLSKEYLPKECHACSQHNECFGGYPIRDASGALVADPILSAFHQSRQPCR